MTKPIISSKAGENCGPPLVAPAPKTKTPLDTFPHEIDIPVRFRLTAAEVSDSFERVHAYRTGQGVAIETERARVLNTRWTLLLKDKRAKDFTRTTVEIAGTHDLDPSFTFDAQGMPTDPKAWAEIVRATLDDAIDSAEERLAELIDAGIDSEKEA